MTQFTREFIREFDRLCISLYFFPQRRQDEECRREMDLSSNRVRQIGEEIHALGGKEALKAAIRSIKPPESFRKEIEQVWQGIGDDLQD